MPPRRICFVNSMRTFGGAEVWTLDAAGGLRERGHQVAIVAQPATLLLERAQGLGLTAACIPVRFDGAWWTLARLHGFFRRQRTDAVLCNLTKDLKAAGVAARLAGVARILALRESDFPLKNKLYYRWYFNRIASGLVVGSRATRTTVLASAPWLDPQRVHLVYKGVDLKRFHVPARPPAEPIVGFLGQLIARKGLPELMQAWSLLEERELTGARTRPRRRQLPPGGPPLRERTLPLAPRLHVAGEGPLREELLRWRAGLRHPDRVRYLGYLERPEDFLAELSLLVLPSRAEGFGLVAAEAGACGVPVIACRASSLPEIVDDGRSGLLVPVTDPEALAATIARLLADPDLRARLGRRARQLVSQRFDRQVMLDRLEQLLEGQDLG